MKVKFDCNAASLLIAILSVFRDQGIVSNLTITGDAAGEPPPDGGDTNTDPDEGDEPSPSLPDHTKAVVNRILMRAAAELLALGIQANRV